MLLENIRNLLVKVQSSNKVERDTFIAEIQNLIWNDETMTNETINDVLTDIAHILDFYESNINFRMEDPSFYGDEQLEIQIKAAIVKIEKFLT